MPREKPIAIDAPAELAQRLSEALLRERLVPRFVDSYVVENGRHALQVHAALYRDLLTLLHNPRASPNRGRCCGEMPRRSAVSFWRH